MVLYVADNGIGIEPRFHDRVFGIFERLERSDRGTGVGLALVRRIIQVHGGRTGVAIALNEVQRIVLVAVELQPRARGRPRVLEVVDPPLLTPHEHVRIPDPWTPRVYLRRPHRPELEGVETRHPPEDERLAGQRSIAAEQGDEGIALGLQRGGATPDLRALGRRAVKLEEGVQHGRTQHGLDLVLLIPGEGGGEGAQQQEDDA